MNVELIYDKSCPNVATARALLIRAFTQTGVSARWKEWERSAPDSPAYVRDFGSPTILVDGNDVADVTPSEGQGTCRIYPDANGNLARTPSLELICSAIFKGAPASTRGSNGKGRWQAVVASFPAIGTALLPKLACPLCFPAYTALLSALKLKFVDYTPYLLPLTIVFFTLAVAVLIKQARCSGRWSSLSLGVGAAAIILIDKLPAESSWLTNAGIILLIVAVVSGMRKTDAQAAPCPACIAGSDEPKTQTR